MIFGLVLTFTTVLNSVTTFADNRNSNYESIIRDSDVMEVINKIINEHPAKNKEQKVNIYNSNLELIRFGGENSESIRNFILRADLFAEINGVKYYRLSY